MSHLQLYPHQTEVLKQTLHHNRVAYYLDMGLGKTHLGSEKMKQLDSPYNLLICQKSKIDDWKEHFETYYDYQVIIYDKQDISQIPTHSILIINYDRAWRRKELLQLKQFTLMLDESQYIKNETAARSKFLLKLKSDNVILLSGTPTGGKYEELWSQCKLLGWTISKELYWKQYVDVELIEGDGYYIPVVKGYKNVERLKEKLKHHGAIFMKSDEVFDLPEQIEQTIKIPMNPEYKKFKKDKYIFIDGEEYIGDNVLKKLLYSRMMAGVYNEGKLDAVTELLESTSDRVIIFYNFKKEFYQLQIKCAELGKPCSWINGDGTNLKAYQEQENSVTLVQYQAGASGVNLQLSNKMIYFTLPLSSELWMQSKKRIHRIGQNKTCFYYYLLTSDSIEFDIMNALRERQDYTEILFLKNF